LRATGTAPNPTADRGADLDLDSCTGSDLDAHSDGYVDAATHPDAHANSLLGYAGFYP
jgi:hypothetical protein